ncbi:MAG: type IV pilus twitching motility protein PilT [Huintestinicola sp.]
MVFSTMNDLVAYARSMKTSDVHLNVGSPTMFRIHGKLVPCDVELTDEEIAYLIYSMLDEDQMRLFEAGEDLDFALAAPDGSRARVNVMRSKGYVGAVLRLLNTYIPSLEELNLPNVLLDIANQPRGLILVTGPTGSGKSTTLAAMINYINMNKPVHILTIEDPIEYIYPQGMASVRQREVGVDVKDFNTALKSALREDPDVILVGEMRDYETISLAVTAAETGHLVMGTLHTTSAAQTVDRIIDACPPHAQAQVRTQVAATLKGVISQCLIPLKSGNGRVAATEILVGTDAAMNLVRTGKCQQLNSTMQMGRNLGMHTLNSDLAQLVRTGKITEESALEYCTDKGDMQRQMGGF